MAKADYRSSIVPSLLDRLLDDDPAISQEPITRHFQNVRELERAVARDIEALLNSRQETLTELPPEFAEVNGSLITYGLPDLTSFSLDIDDDRNRIRRLLEQVIDTFEPRLARIHVTLEGSRAQERGLRFSISALLRVDPAPEPVRFDAMLQVNTQQYTVKGPD
jgi:type VI secretion system protein ImpF